MSAHGKHLGWRSWSSDTILKVSILLTWKILALPYHFTQSDGFGAPKKVSLHPLLLAHDQWFSPDIPASFTTKIGRHDIAEILLKVALNTKKQSINI
jgi:hypothetical protein